MGAALVPDNPEQLAQGRQDSNLQPAVLETAALPIAPLPYGAKTSSGQFPQTFLRHRPSSCFQHRKSSLRNNCAYVEPALPGPPVSPRKHRKTTDKPPINHRKNETINQLRKPSDQSAVIFKRRHRGRSGEQHRVGSVESHQQLPKLLAKNGPAMTAARISQRISAIAESATLAVDAKAKALKAAGRPVSGFGAG